MTEAVFTKTFDLLHISQAAVAQRPVPATRWRHRDTCVFAPPTKDAPDAALFLGVVTFQAEPSHPGAYLWGLMDVGTGDVDLHVDVVDHPLDRVESFRAAERMCRAVAEHLAGPHAARTVDGTPVELIDTKARAGSLPRIIVANQTTLMSLQLLGHTFTYLKAPEDADAATIATVETVHAGGRWLREIAAVAKYTGQNQVVNVLEVLRELYVVPLPNEEQGHLAAVCAAIDAGPAQAWSEESRFVGPIPDPVTQDELWERHNHLRDRLRGKVTSGPGVTTTRASLASRYEALATDTVDACVRGLRLAAAVPGEPTFAAVRRAEDLHRYAEAGSRAVGWTNPGRAIRPILENHRTGSARERALTLHELRRLAIEPKLRAPLWATGAAIDGACTSAIPRKVATGSTTPTGKAQMTGVWDVTVEVYDAITLPRVGDPCLWCGDLKVAGVVTGVTGREVTIHVPAPATILMSLQMGQSDAWLIDNPPFIGLTMAPRRDELPALFRRADPPPDGRDQEAGDAEVTAIVEAATDADREYQ